MLIDESKMLVDSNLAVMDPSYKIPRKHKILAQQNLKSGIAFEEPPGKKKRFDAHPRGSIPADFLSSTEEEFSPAPPPTSAGDIMTEAVLDNIFDMVIVNNDDQLTENNDHETPNCSSNEILSEEHSPNVFEYLTSLSQEPTDLPDESVAACMLHVKEIYQEAFLVDETQEGTILLTPSSEPLETSFELPIEVDNEGCLDVSVNFPPRLLIHMDDSPIIDVSDCRVEEALDCDQEPDITADLQTMIEGHEATISLRKRIFRLLSAIIPALDLSDFFNCVTSDTDRLLDATIDALDSTDSSDTTNLRDLAVLQLFHCEPLVQMCPEPFDCLSTLRGKVLLLLERILPNLCLPANFTIEDDLEELLVDITKCNR